MNGNYGLVYPSESDYYDVGVTNLNFSKLADSIDDIKSGGLKKEVVVAAYNSLNPYKEVSDYVCGRTNASEVLANAVNDCCEGGVILFLDGDYYFSSAVEINKSVTLWGYGSSTRFIQGDEFTGYALIKLNKADSVVREICFEDNLKAVGGIHFINVNAVSVSVGDCSFIMNRGSEDNYVAPVYITAYRCRILMVGCFIRKHNDLKYTISANETALYGVVMGNYCECIDDDSELSVRINVVSSDSVKKIKCGAQDTMFFVKGGKYNE